MLSATSFEEVPQYLPPQYQLFNYGGYLTGPSGQTPVKIAENYLRANAAAVGMLPSDLDGYLVTTNYVTQTTGATTLTFQQTVGGIGVANANFNITVAADGRILSVGGGFVPGLSTTPHTLPTQLFNAPQAITSAAGALGLGLSSAPTFLGHRPDGSSVYRAPGVSNDDVQAVMRYVATPSNTVDLVWNLTIRTPGGDHWYSLDVDVRNGAIRGSLDYVNDANYEVFAIPKRDPNDGSRTIVVDPHIITPTPSPVPSPFGWHDTDGVAGPEFTITSGNNVNAYTDTDGDDQPDANSQPDGGAALDFSGALVALDLSQDPSTYAAAAVTNLFYWNNISHDVHYLYGFDEAARNFQVNNYGRGGVGNDAVRAEAQDGSGLNNANFATPPDGMEPTMQMFLFDLTTPMRDGDFDAEIIIHEYGHGVSNRLTGNGAGLFALQSGGMGEGWSDWWSLMLTQKTADETTVGRGVGNYVLGLPSSGPGVRDFRYDFDITNQFQETFLSYGTGAGQDVEVHFSGTRWTAALWDITHLFIEKYGFESNVYNSTSTAGNIRAMHLIMNALKIQPLNPTFISARDAILMADQMLYGGANQFEIWTAFARRGLGAGAFTSGPNATSISTSFEIPEGLLPMVALGPDLAAVEGHTGTKDFVFTVNVSGNFVTDSITVNYATVDQTAIGGIDYVAVSGTLTFDADGPTTLFIVVQVIGDVEVEANESFAIVLSDLSSGNLGRSQATGTILNDDVDISVGDVTVVEGNSGTTNAVFTVSTIGSLNESITASYATSDGTAQAGIDYQARTGSIVFAPGVNAINVTVPVIGDTFNEGTEMFFLVLHAVTGARVAKGAGIGTILDNDPLPALFVNDVNVTTTQAGILAAVFTVGLDTPSGRDVWVHYSTLDDTAHAGASYIAQAGDLHFAPGVRTQTVIVPITTSAVYSPNQRFFLDLSAANGALVSDGRGIGTIIYAETPPVEYVVDDGDAGFATTGSGWTNVTNLLTYQLDYTYHTAGTGSNTATWTFTNMPSGSYQIYTRWSQFSNRATNAPYTILNGNTPLGTVSVNQQVAPAGDLTNGVTWYSLGTFQFTTGTIRVRLADDANGYVVADAVRVVPGSITTQVPEIDVAGFEHSIGDGDMIPALDDATEFGSTPTTSNSVLHTFTITNTGNAPLHLTGSPLVQISGANAADFTVVSPPASLVAPGTKTSFQILFHPTATGLRQATVSIASDDANEPLYTFAIQGTGSGAGPSQFTVDDSTADFAMTGNWSTGANGLAVLGGVHTSAPGQGNQTTWSFSGLAPGAYDVYATWSPFSNRATNAPYTVSDGNGTSYTARVNQQQTTAAAPGMLVGTIDVTLGLLTVTLSDDADGFVVADSITVARQGGTPVSAPAALFAHNPAAPVDVNNDNSVTPVDALIVINTLLSTGSGGAAFAATSTTTPRYFIDVSADGIASPLDALLVINQLTTAALAASTTSAPLLAEQADQPPPAAAAELSAPSSPPALAAVAVDLAIGEVDGTPYAEDVVGDEPAAAPLVATATEQSGTVAAILSAATVEDAFAADDELADQGELDELLLALGG